MKHPFDQKGSEQFDDKVLEEVPEKHSRSSSRESQELNRGEKLNPISDCGLGVAKKRRAGLHKLIEGTHPEYPQDSLSQWIRLRP